MFTFDLSTIDDRDLSDTVDALLMLLDIPGQDSNRAIDELLNYFTEEARRREAGEESFREVEIQLHMSELTGAHLWMLTTFACNVVKVAAGGTPAAMTLFFARVVDEIETSAQRLKAATQN